MTAGAAVALVMAASVVVPALLRAGARTVYWIAAPIAVIAIAALLRLAKANSG